jgi:tripartite-type tricarboxylate transporter receptor subunit TctC
MQLRGAIRRLISLSFVGLMLLSAPGQRAHAQTDAANFPNRPIRIIVAFAAGGGNDIIARIVAPKMSENMGQPIIIENRPGAASITGTDYAKNAAPDGYTLLMGATGAMSVNPAVYTKLPYNSLKDFVPLSMIVRFPLIMVATPSLPVKSVQELVAYAKANPAKANYASSATPFLLTTELFKQKTGAPMENITYKSSGESIVAVMTGQVLTTIADTPPTAPQIKAGNVRALAVTGKERLPDFPDVPTFAEVGIPEIEVYLWTGMFVPAGTPAAIVKKLQDEIIRAVKTPEVSEKLKTLSLQPVASTSEEFSRVIAAEIARWTAVAKAANIRIQP